MRRLKVHKTAYFNFILILFLIIPSTSFAATLRPTLAILPFEANGGVSQTDTDAIYELLTTKVILSAKFRVVERSMINKLMEEQGFSLSDFVDNKDVVRIGEMLSTEWVIIGSISKIGSKFSMVIRLVNINTGINEKAGAITQSSIEGISNELDKLISQITSMTTMGNQILNIWGLEILGNAVWMRNSFYAAGASIGILRRDSMRTETGIWAGCLMKPDRRMYLQGGFKMIFHPTENIGLTINIGLFPSAGVYFKNIYIDASPLWLFGYEGFDATVGYVFRF
jgi:TolB-like protein